MRFLSPRPPTFVPLLLIVVTVLLLPNWPPSAAEGPASPTPRASPVPTALPLPAAPGASFGAGPTTSAPTSGFLPRAGESSLPPRGAALPGEPSPFLAGPAPSGPLVGGSSNVELDNYSATTSVAPVGPSNQTVVVGATDESTAVSGSGFFWSHGFSAAYRTNDGGLTWSTGWLGQNSSWTSPSSGGYGDITFGEPSLAGGSNGTVLYAAVYAQPCALFAFDFGETLNCNSTIEGYSAPGGIAVARSTNSGVTWQDPTPVNNLSWFQTFSITCGSTVYSGPLPSNISDKPSVAYSAASGLAVVSWDVISYDISLSCQGGVGVYTVNSVDYSTDVAVSRDNGVTWSAPRTVGRVASIDAAVAIGPAPTYPLSVVYADYVNGTSTTYTFAYAQSTDDGTHWSAPADIGARTLVHPNEGSPPDAFVGPSIPSLAVDSWAGSSFRGASYVVWGDNRTAGPAGSPSVDLIRSASGGSAWSGATVVDAANSTAQYFEPAVSVGPAGRVWLVFYEMDPHSGAYKLFGQYSNDGGVLWTTPFPVADQSGNPGVLVTSIGAWVGAAATSAGLYSAWTDCRWSGCALNGETAVYAARTVPVTIASSTPGVVATSNVDGVGTVGATPLPTAWDNGASVAVNVSSWVPGPNGSEYVAVFSNFSGVISSSSDSVFFDYGGGSVLTANYVAAPAGWISGTVAPASALPTVRVGGLLAALSPWNATALAFNVTVQAGASYAVVVSAPEYQSHFENDSPSAFRAVTLTISLPRSDGSIRGTLEPPTATLEVNGTAVPNVDPTTGLYLVSVAWGSYWVNATGTGLDSSSQYVTVSPGASTVVDFSLVGGWIDGTVSPTNATVRVDGTVVALTNGAFNVSVLGGSHNITASAPGYAGYHSSLMVAPTQQANVAISLTDSGWIEGTVSPVTASVVVGGNLVPVLSGAFQVYVRGGSIYNVTVTAAGFYSGGKNVAVTPANVSYANFTLTAVPSTCSSCGSPGSGGTHSAATALPYSWLDVGIAAVIVLGLALAVAFLVLRGGEGGSESTPEEYEAAPPDEELYPAEGSPYDSATGPGSPDGSEPPP
jgi:hypothetical protein